MPSISYQVLGSLHNSFCFSYCSTQAHLGEQEQNEKQPDQPHSILPTFLPTSYHFFSILISVTAQTWCMSPQTPHQLLFIGLTINYPVTFYETPVARVHLFCSRASFISQGKVQISWRAEIHILTARRELQRTYFSSDSSWRKTHPLEG